MKFNFVWQYLKNSLYHLLFAIDRIMWDILYPELYLIEIKQSLGCMNKENASKLWKIIQEAGDYLRG